MTTPSPPRSAVASFVASLRARLILALIAVALLGAVGLAVIVQTDRLSANDALEDTSLSAQAQALASRMQFDPAGRLMRVVPPKRWRQAYRTPGAAYYTVYDPAHRPVAWSANLSAPLPLGVLPPGRALSPLTVVGPDQDLVMTARARYGHALVVERSNPGALDEANPSPWGDFLPLWVFAGVISLGVLLVWLMAEWSLNPLRRASREAAAIGPDNPEARLTVPGLPSEARPLAQAMNGALDRVAAAYAAQKRFTADAAHALRTPVAVMDLRLQRATATGVLDQAALKADLQEVARMIGGLLNLAHAEHDADAQHPPVNVARLLREQAAALQPLLDAQGRAIVVEAADVLALQGDVRALRDMIGALLENALQHGAGQITARLQARDGALWLEVEDQGVGVPAQAQGLVFERFSKLAAASPGAGLGLAIVRQIAVGMGGTAGFIAPSRVQVRLPL